MSRPRRMPHLAVKLAHDLAGIAIRHGLEVDEIDRVERATGTTGLVAHFVVERRKRDAERAARKAGA